MVVGPTASGKTALLAELFGSPSARDAFGLPGAEVISADSMQAYRGMDIGTAKPEISLRTFLPHRLLDIRGIDEQYSVGDFVRLADEACAEIASAGKLPVVSGGTGFYIRNFICGLPSAPAAGPLARSEVARDLAEKGPLALREELASLDPESAARIHANDLYRLTRALEITRLTGRPMADFASPASPRSRYRFATIGVMRPREEILARIGARVDAMMAAGLAEEVAALRAAGARADDPGMAAIGYREFFDPRFGIDPMGAELKEIADAIKLDTRQYAKRQMTFFRRLPGIEWIDPDPEALASRLRAIVQEPCAGL